MFGKLKWVAGVALAASVSLAAQSALADTTIRMWTFLNPEGQSGREMVLKKLIESFEAENPGVKIQVEPQAWQQLTDKFLAANQTGTAPDVAFIRNARILEVIDTGAMANLDELWNLTPEEEADIDGAAWRYGATPDAHYHFIHFRGVIGILYRKDLFEEAGIDPATITTWDKVVEAAKQLTVRDADGNVVQWGFIQPFAHGDNITPKSNIMLEEQGDLFDAEGNPRWANETAVTGMNWELDMIRKHEVEPASAMSMIDDDMYDQFKAGRVAMVYGATVRLPNQQDVLGADNVGYLPTPAWTEGATTHTQLSGWAVAVWSGSPNIELAADWLAYMSSPEADELWVKEAGMPPNRASTIENNPEFFNRPSKDYLVGAFKEMATGWAPGPGVVGGFFDDLSLATRDVYINGMEPMAALEKAEESYMHRKR